MEGREDRRRKERKERRKLSFDSMYIYFCFVPPPTLISTVRGFSTHSFTLYSSVYSHVWNVQPEKRSVAVVCKSSVELCH